MEKGIYYFIFNLEAFTLRNYLLRSPSSQLQMLKRFDLLLILAFMVLVLLKPDFLVKFISRKEVLTVFNILIGGYLLYYLAMLIKNRQKTKRFWLKAFFTSAILILPVLFLMGVVVFDAQALLLYMIILGFFYMTILS